MQDVPFASYAMVLSNMNRSTFYMGKDVRDADANGNMTNSFMISDPYSVMWATSYRPSSITYNSVTDRYIAVSSMDPVNTDLPKIAESFGVNYKWYEIQSQTVTYKKQMIAALLSMYPQGLCLYFSTASSTHMIVVTSTTFEAPLSFVLPTPYLQSSFTNAANNEYELDSCTIISKEDELVYENWIKNRSISSITDGDLFTVFDPYCGSNGGEGITLSNSYAGSVFTWANLQSIRVLC